VPPLAGGSDITTRPAPTKKRERPAAASRPPQNDKAAPRGQVGRFPDWWASSAEPVSPRIGQDGGPAMTVARATHLRKYPLLDRSSSYVGRTQQLPGGLGHLD